jgi:hypothetical protein
MKRFLKSIFFGIILIALLPRVGSAGPNPPSPPIECNTDADCPQDEFCPSSGTCQPCAQEFKDYWQCVTASLCDADLDRREACLYNCVCAHLSERCRSIWSDAPYYLAGVAETTEAKFGKCSTIRKPIWLNLQTRVQQPRRKTVVIATPLLGSIGADAKIVTPSIPPGSPPSASAATTMIPEIADCPSGYEEQPELEDQCPKDPSDIIDREMEELLKADGGGCWAVVDYYKRAYEQIGRIDDKQQREAFKEHVEESCRCGWNDRWLTNYVENGWNLALPWMIQNIEKCYHAAASVEYGAFESTSYCKRTDQAVNSEIKCPDPRARPQFLSNSTDLCCGVYKKPFETMTHQRDPGITP